MLNKLNQWAKHWGPSVALYGLAIATLTFAFDYGPLGPTIDHEQPASENVAPVILSRPSILPGTIESAKTHVVDQNPIGLQLDCKTLLRDPDFYFSTRQQRDEIKEVCLSPYVDHAYIRHFDRKIAGNEHALIESSGKLLSKLHNTPIMSTDYDKVCEDGHKLTFSSLISFSWASVALKAYIIAESIGLGSQVLESLDRGVNPQRALPALQLLSASKTTDYVGQSTKILATYRIDSFLKQYTDGILIAWAEKLHSLLPASRRAEAKQLIKIYLDRYHQIIKPRSGDLVKLYRSTMESHPLVEVNAGRIIANFPNDEFHFSCVDNHIDEFWLRRIINGTDLRVASLGEKFLERN